ncbi:MAG: hypothetical protein A2V78_07200 [Betaproteobacteria bacterium RBG_16_64_18]|nr:MAG: hypothetical protein A2V78_07200 [Betaproteobacteria bacterium RBG_16_64_18]OGA14650.1 MAG: hypothetical protein A3H33_12375 [Betaproteobacteria bacterium RIFCSPLOWO2_02_FULL_65_20]OGA43824.1 MAG: hypothetical protein A3G26_12280 [Betaproteobacteria bacterium RIFCSPLOWO2_12_FULL_65_110]
MNYVPGLAALLLGATFAVHPGELRAQPSAIYPSKPVRIIVSIAAGSLTDVVARTAGQHLRNSLGQPVVIDNRPGGNMTIGAEACARAAPDGYTFCLLSNTSISLNPHVYSKLSYDPEKDFRPVALLFYLIQGLFASASLPVNSVQEVQALATAKPGSLNFGTLGAGTGPDIFRQWLNEHWKTNVVGIPYTGANLIMSALITGDIHLTQIGPGPFSGQLRAGKVKLLAVGLPKRSRLFPDVPTYAETGLDGFSEKLWWGLFAPAGTPDTVAKRINTEFGRLFQDPKFLEYLENQFIEPMTTKPEEFAAFLKEERELAGLMVKRYNFPRQ